MYVCKKVRRHYNNKGYQGIKSGRVKRDIERIIKKLRKEGKLKQNKDQV